MSNLYQANRQWASRPADERLWALEEAHAAIKRYAEAARTYSRLQFGTNLEQRFLIE
ncbi:MAG: hypothetical protein U0744_00605 [Gemmataceae bacterium]